MKKCGLETRIGVAGCGAMGLPMAQALIGAGYDVQGFDIKPVDEFGGFQSRMVSSAEQFSDMTDVLISVVRNERQTLDLYFERQALFRQPNYPEVCLLASTVSPRFLEEVSVKLPEDVLFFEIPMSGAPFAAIEARLTFMVGADETTAAPVRNLLDVMGEKVYYLGGLTRGMTCKVLNNFVAASSVVAVRQVLKEAASFGISPDLLLEVMASSSGGTWFGDNFAAIEWSREIYSPTNTVGLIEKDVDALLRTLESDRTDEESIAFIRSVRDRLSDIPPFPDNNN